MKQLLAIWITMLMISMPIMSASALGSLTINRFSGTANIPDTVKTDDTLTVEALVSLPNDGAISNSQFRIFAGSTNYPATSCVFAQGTEWKCTYTTNAIDGYGTLPFTFQTRSDSGAVVDTKTRTLKIDDQGAVITQLELPVKVAGQRVRIPYRAQDSLTSGFNGQCSGVDHVTLHIGGIAGGALKTNKHTGTCDESGSFSDVTISGSGTKTICLTAYDRLGQTDGPRCEQVEVDGGPPQITGINVTDSQGMPLRYLSEGGGIGDVGVIISGGDIVADSIRADFSKVTNNPAYANQAPSQVLGTNPVIAIFPRIPILSASACQVPIHVEDDVGAVTDRTVSCGLSADSSRPRLISLSSDHMTAPGEGSNESAVYLIGRTGRITAVMSDSGSGLADRHVFLDAKQIGLDARLRASNCSGDGDSWNCVWTVHPTVSGRFTLKLNPVTADDVGNTLDVSSNTGVTFISDTSGPTDASIVSVKPLHGAVDLGNVTVQGDIVEFKVQARNFDLGWADFTRIGGNTSDCEREGDICTYTVPVGVSGPARPRVSFTFADFAGNNITLPYEMNILGTRNATKPNHWTNAVICTPELVDRSITTLVNVRVYCHIKLTSSTTGAKTAAIGFDPAQCTGDVSSIGDLGLSNSFAGSTEPILYALLSAKEYKVNALDFKCPLKIVTRVGDYVDINPENETVNVHIGFFSRPQSDIAKSINAKFEKAKADALKLDGLIGTLEKMIVLFEKICQVRGLILDALTAIDSVMDFINLVKAGAFNVDISIADVARACSPYNMGIYGQLQGAYGLANANAQQRQGVAIKEAGKAPALQTPGSTAQTVGTPSGTPGDSCDAGATIAASQKQADQVQSKENSATNTAVDNGVTAALDPTALLAARCAANPLDPTCPTGPGISTVTALECERSINMFKNSKTAHDKLEKARSEFCQNKEGLVKQFTCSVDKFAAPFCNFVNCNWGPSAGGAEGGIFGKVAGFMGKINPNNYLPTVAGIGPSLNVKGSMVWSVASLCLPGIIHNVDKYRQINCAYALCIGKDVVEHGLPISACEKKREALMCEFVWGQVFNSVPYVGAVQGWIDTLKELLTNPIAAITFILGQYCKAFCDESRTDRTATMYKICAIPKTADAIAKVINDIKSMANKEFFSLGGQSQCDQLKDFKPATVSVPKKAPEGVVNT